MGKKKDSLLSLFKKLLEEPDSIEKRRFNIPDRCTDGCEFFIYHPSECLLLPVESGECIYYGKIIKLDNNEEVAKKPSFCRAEYIEVHEKQED